MAAEAAVVARLPSHMNSMVTLFIPGTTADRAESSQHGQNNRHPRKNQEKDTEDAEEE